LGRGGFGFGTNAELEDRFDRLRSFCGTACQVVGRAGGREPIIAATMTPNAAITRSA
jgi:hypothetical protein